MTNEVEEDKKLARFDILIIRTEAGCAKMVDRRKSASDIDRYKHYTSAQVWKKKSCAIRTFKFRAIDCCSNEALLAEVSYVLEVFLSYGHSKSTVWRML